MLKQDYEFRTDLLKGLIYAVGISAETVASGCGLSVASVNSYVSGRSVPSVSALIKLSDYFAVPMDYLAGRCNRETAEDIQRDYSKNFMKIRRDAYESYLIGRRPLPEIEGYEAPWPYNLLDDIESSGKREFWKYILDDDQMYGLEKALNTLTEREKRFVLRYYKDGLSLEKIGKEETISRDRVRQIIKKAIRKLRHPSRYEMIELGFETLNKKNELWKLREEIENERKILNELEKEMRVRRDKCMSKVLDASEYNTLDEDDILGVNIDEMDMSVRSRNCLVRAGCKTLKDVVLKIQEGNITKIRNLGKRSAEEILCKVYTYTGVRYGIDGRKLN